MADGPPAARDAGLRHRSGNVGGRRSVHFISRWLQAKRYAAVLPQVRGRLLDIGCGRNGLVRSYGDGIGVDVHPWPGVDVLIGDAARLPFPDGCFDTIAFVACLNHIPNRLAALREARRCLRAGGRVLITMIGPRISKTWHRINRRWDEDQTERGMKTGEVYGIGRSEMRDLLEQAGFEIVERRPFLLRLNTLYIARTCDPRSL